MSEVTVGHGTALTDRHGGAIRDTKGEVALIERQSAVTERERGRQQVAPRPAEMAWIDMAETDLVEMLRSSLYPGATDASIRNVIAYCKAGSLNVMLKPVHIVPMYVKNAGGNGGSMRDVIMPGINHYRTQASRSGVYMGMTLPEWGPMTTYDLADGNNGTVKVTVPEWCRITVKKMVQGQIVDFPAEEYWIENYATAGRDTKKPNAMWGTRARGQLAKVTEAQALRKAFPEFTGDATVEEMEGKVIDAGAITEGGGVRANTGDGVGATAQLDRFAGGTAKGGDETGAKAGAEQKKPSKSKAKAEPEGGAESAAAPADTGEVPTMPADASNAWEVDGKWAKGWRWLNETLPGLGPKSRQAVVDEHVDLLWAVHNESDAYRKASLEFVQKMGVKVPDPKPKEG